MNTALFTTKILLVTIALVATFVSPLLAKVASGALQSCKTNTSCTIGEFLYNDSYAPIADATCTLTSRDPSGNVYLDAVEMTVAADGWYFHQFTAPSTTGTYRSQVCCTSGTDYLCLDKSFTVDDSDLSQSDVANAVWDADRSSHTAVGTFGESLQNLMPSTSDIAAATWGYSSRTLSSYGSLISDIWSNPSRSLTTFGTLVADIWNNATRTLTGAGLDSGSLATVSDVDSVQSDVSSVKSDVSDIKSDVSSIKSTVSSLSTKTDSVSTNVINNYTLQTTLNQTLSEIKKETDVTRELVEPLVNKPTVENFLEEAPDLTGKLDQSEALAKAITVKTGYLKSKTALLDSRKNQLTEERFAQSLIDLSQVVGDKEDVLADGSLFGQLNWLKEAWGWQVTERSLTQLDSIQRSLLMAKKQVEAGHRTLGLMKSLASPLSKFEDTIGQPSSASSPKTLFGQIRQTKELAGVLDMQAGEAKALLGNWQVNPDRPKQINQLSKEVASTNQFTKINPMVLSKVDQSAPERNQKNKVLGLKGLIEANIRLLAAKANVPFASTWLEEGSVVFKTLVTNPSKKISQAVAVKYYLPAEVKKEDILSIDEGLEILFDSEKNQFYVSGEVELAASESRTFSVRVEDVWQYPEEEIESLRKQAAELAKPLDDTSYFAQGVTLKTDIDASLDKVAQLQKSATTPDSKIRAYREAQIEMKAAQAKLDKLKDLVSAAGSVGTLFGFVGGSQVLAAWGLIIIITAGFVFMVLYMRVLRPATLTAKCASVPDSVKVASKGSHSSFQRKLGLLILFLAFGIFTSLATAMVVSKMSNQSEAKTYNEPVTREPQQRSETAKEASSSAAPLSQASNRPEVLGTSELFVPPGALVTLHSQPSLVSPVLATFKGSQKAQILEESSNWVKVAVGLVEGWVDKDFLLEENKESLTQKFVEIKETPTGFLRVRQTPGGLEIGRVKPFDTFPLTQEIDDWSQIQLEDQTLGWVSRHYVASR